MKRCYFIKSLFLLFFIISVSSCSKPQDLLDIRSIEDVQEQVSYIINSRKQISDVKYSNNNLSFLLNKKQINFNTRVLPFVYPNKKGRWEINGEELACIVKKDSDGNLVFPTLKISSDGFLVVNGTKTHFSWGYRQNSSVLSNQSRFWVVSNINTYLCFYGFNDSDMITEVIPIVINNKYVIPDYFFDCVVEKELLAERTVEAILPELSLSYVFFTDAHWGKNQQHSPAIIKHIVDYTPIDQVLFGGDVITSQTETVQGAIDIGNQFHDAFSFLGSQFYCLFGNHDDNSTGQPTQTDRHLSEEQVYAYLQSQMTNVHYGNYFNFYYDNSLSKTRFICLDTGRLYLESKRGTISKTAKFLIECLSSVPPNWHIVVASHIWTNLISFETGETKESKYVRPIISILEDYNLRIKSSFTYGDETMYYDYTDSKATVEYCIGGHTHSDAIALSQRGLPLITVTSDGQLQVAGNAQYETGTINEQCVTIIVNDYDKRIVHIFHIGRGDDVMVNMWKNAYSNNSGII